MMPWEKPPARDDLGSDVWQSVLSQAWDAHKIDSLEIPAFLKRDANNVAPYMLNHANSPQPKAQAAPLPWESSSSSHS